MQVSIARFNVNINFVKTDWINLLEKEQNKDYWKQLNNLVDKAYQESTCWPKQDKIFDCFNYFNVKDTKVVIIGQDPYHTSNVANGLCFSTYPNNQIPASLKNIFKELESDLGIKRTNPDLSDWAKQGVLLLNNTLTVTQHQANSHSKFGWNTFTNNIIKYINDNLDHVIFVLWGNFAKTKKELITNKTHSIIYSAHPSPLSYHNGFKGSRPFSKINEILRENNKETIKW